MQVKATKKEKIRGFLELLAPVFILIVAGYLLASGQKVGAIVTAMIGFFAYGNAMCRSAEYSVRKHGCRLAMLDGELATPESTRRFMSRGQFEIDKTYLIEGVHRFRDTNIVVAQEEGCPIGTLDTVRIFTTRRPLGRRLRFFMRRNPGGKLIWDFESVQPEKVKTFPRSMGILG